MKFFSLPGSSGKKRIREIIQKNVSEKTERYRSDNIRLMHQYMNEQARMSEVQESIRYAHHLQNALLPSEQELSLLAGESFFLSIPRDTLTGDFAWWTKCGTKMIIAVADCTGHGIPGALMSVLGLSLLNQVVLEERCTEPSHILRRIDEKMRITFLHGQEARRGSYDGMDIALCTIDPTERKISFAGAMRSSWIVSQNGLFEITGVRYPIGGLRLEANRTYPSQNYFYEPGDFLYLFTDGYSDQFGGAKEKKMTRSRMRRFIETIFMLSAPEQKEQLHEFFLLWKREQEQTDDVTIVGLRLQ